MGSGPGIRVGPGLGISAVKAALALADEEAYSVTVHCDSSDHAVRIMKLLDYEDEECHG